MGEWDWALIATIGVPVLGAAAVAFFLDDRRRKEAEENSLPFVEVNYVSPVDNRPGWYSATIQVRNRDAPRWTVFGARVQRPHGAKILSASQIAGEAAKPYEAAPILIERLDPTQWTNNCALGLDLAPAGSFSGTLVSGTNDAAQVDLFLFIPPGTEAHRAILQLSMLSSAVDGKVFPRPVTLDLPPRHAT